MKHLRLSIAGIMAVVALAGLGFAGLRASTPIWASGLFTAAVFLLSAAVVGSILTKGASLTGAAVFGWIYLVVVFGPWSPNRDGPPSLLTVPLLELAQDKILSREGGAYRATDHLWHGSQDLRVQLWRGTAPSANPTRTVDLVCYRQVGQSLAALIFAAAGAVVGALIAARRREES
jgi:hypothetical protein